MLSSLDLRSRLELGVQVARFDRSPGGPAELRLHGPRRRGRAAQTMHVVPVSWSASDDEGLRSFANHASYDGGRAWHVVTSDLPATARSFDWRIPSGASIDDARVGVIAKDQRFFNASDEAALALGSGAETPPEERRSGWARSSRLMTGSGGCVPYVCFSTPVGL